MTVVLFSLLYLLSALSISAIAAYFSVLGLATIFPGAIIPIIIMGGVLELGKIITAIWLHRNWKTAPLLIRSYLSFAVFTLMGITSMGIFGFLSKAHIEHQVTTEKAQALTEQVENKISREEDFVSRQKEYISNLEDRASSSTSGIRIDIDQENARIADITGQMNKDIAFEQERIDAASKKISDLKAELTAAEQKSGGIFSNKKKAIEELKARQKAPLEELSAAISSHNKNIDEFRERAQDSIKKIEDKKDLFRAKTETKGESLAPEIEQHNKNIAEAYDRIDALEKEKFGYEDNSKALEAEVGPVKYVAELIADLTGAEFDMAQAVRIVIIILIFVFDPLAILLVIAANISIAKHFPQKSKEYIDSKKASETLESLEKDLEKRREALGQNRRLLEKGESELESDIKLAGKSLKILQDTIEKNEKKIKKQQESIDKKKEEEEEASAESLNRLNKTLTTLAEKKNEILAEEKSIKSALDSTKEAGLILKEEEAKNSAKESSLLITTQQLAETERANTRRIEEQEGVIKELNEKKDSLKKSEALAREELESAKHSVKVQKALIASLDQTYSKAARTDSIRDLFSRHGVDETVKLTSDGGKLLSIRDKRGRVHQFMIPAEYSSLKHDYFHEVVRALGEIADSDGLAHAYSQEITKYIRGPRPRYNCLT
jgi:hypothetical protein